MHNEKRRPRRTFVEIENDIMNATRLLIEENGIANLSLRGIARKAGIESSVFYNRYKDLSELLEKFIEKNDYWYDELISSFANMGAIDYPSYSKEIFVTLIGALKENKSMQQILLWELMEDNHITSHTAQMREQYTEHIVQAFEDYFKANNLKANPRVVAGIFIAAIYFIVIHKGKITFCGINYSTPQGEDLLAQGIRDILDRVYAENEATNQMLEVAKRMKRNGISDPVIAECTQLSPEQIGKIDLTSYS